jgi:hypothetical protein
MNNLQLFEKELKTLTELDQQQHSSNTIHQAHLKAKESFLQTDFIGSIKQLLSNFLQSTHLNAASSSSAAAADIVQQLTSIVMNEFKSNYFYLNLLTSSQAVASYLDTDNSVAAHTSDVYLAESAQLFNNLAINHFNLKKYTISSLYLQKALAQSSKHMSRAETTAVSPGEANNHHLAQLLQNRHYEIAYNAGVSLLYSKQPVAAFECLHKLCGVFNQNARLWLRMAECCSMCYKHSLNQEDAASSQPFVNFNATASGNEKIFKLSEKIKCISKSFGQGYHHKISVGGSLGRDYTANPLKVSDFTDAASTDNEDEEERVAFARFTTLEYAYMCLRNALSLLPSNDRQFFASLKSESLLKSSSGAAATAVKLNSTSLDEAAAGSGVADNDDNSVPSNDEVIENELDTAGAKLNLNRSMDQQQKLYSCVWPSAPINLAQLQSLRSSILIQLAYVSLTLKDYVSTVKYANSLLDSNDLLNIKCPIANGTK